MKHYSLYILYSEGHDKYSVGQSEDVATRLLFHGEQSVNSFISRYSLCHSSFSPAYFLPEQEETEELSWNARILTMITIQ